MTEVMFFFFFWGGAGGEWETKETIAYNGKRNVTMCMCMCIEGKDRENRERVSWLFWIEILASELMGRILELENRLKYWKELKDRESWN